MSSNRTFFAFSKLKLNCFGLDFYEASESILMMDFIGAFGTCFDADETMLDRLVLSWPLVMETYFFTKCLRSIFETNGRFKAFLFLSMALPGDSS